MSLRRVLLWRHGRTTWNAEKRFQGQADPPLDDLGRQQAEAAAPILAEEAPQLLLSSDLVRAADTARVLGTLLEVEPTFDPRLREADLGRWQGMTREQVGAAYPDELKAWQAGKVVRRGGGELQTEVADRALAVLSEVDAESVILVTHGGTAKALTGRLLELPEEMWRVIAPLGNCHWTDLRHEPAGWRIYRHNVGPRGVPVSPALSKVDAEPVVDADDTGGAEEPVVAAATSTVDDEADRLSRAQVAGDYRLAQLKGELPESTQDIRTRQ